MSLALLAPLLGGVGLFLIGMRMMTDGLKLAAGGALADLLRAWTSSPGRGLLVGALISAVVQSSSAVTVATLGFVNAGLLTLAQAVWLVFGANVGTTMTGWLVAIVGVKIDPAALALPLVGLGALAGLLAGERPRLAGAAQACAGFGAFFLGVAVLQSGFAGLAETWDFSGATLSGPAALLAYAAAGAAITVLTQSSSAAVAVVLTAAAGGAAPLEAAAAAVVGANVGTTSTAVFAAIGATAAARRLAAAHIVFNLLTGAVALLLLPVLLGVIDRLAVLLDLGVQPATRLALFHTVFNLLGVALMAPLAPALVARLSTLFVTPVEDQARPRHLDATLLGIPSVALQGLLLETARLRDLSYQLLAGRMAGASGGEVRVLAAALPELSKAIRDFIARLQTRPLPEDVVQRLPDVIRAIQHLEEINALAHGWRAEPLLDQDLRLEFRRLSRLAEEALSAPGEQDVEAEQVYQTLKAALLHRAAVGDLPMARMDEALMAAADLRRAAVLALKTARRLAMAQAPGGEAAVAAAEAADPSQT